MTGWLVPADPSSRSHIGGVPDAPADFRWPSCRQCGGPMQFIAQLALPDCGIPSLAARQQLLLLFQCQNQPGLCDEWDPEAGGNAALLVPAGAVRPVAAPADGDTLLPAVDPVRVSATETASALGSVGGDPDWVQGDETPLCPRCGSPMQFIVQLGPDGGGGINFGDAGEGYAFVCANCPGEARFLWQCG